MYDGKTGGLTTKSVHDVCERVDELVSVSASYKEAQRRVRDVMNGGASGIRALVGARGQADMDFLEDLPTGNPMLSGLTALGQKLQQVPDLRVKPDKDTDRSQEYADIRAKRVRDMDDCSALEMQMPQAGLWLPGYGFCVWVIVERYDRQGQPYPSLELRDPMESHPGDWGTTQQPDDIAFVRQIPVQTLARMYPEHARSLMEWKLGGSMSSSPFPATSDSGYRGGSAWAQRSQGVTVAEYFDANGCWWVIPERKLLLEFKPNPISSAAFHVAKRFAFDRLQGQWDQVVGIMAMFAKLTVLQAQWVQDSVHTETNIVGGQAPSPYRKGRFAINELEAGTQVVKPTNNMPFQAFQAIDRLERQLRTTARYPVTDDAQSPTSWATGAGLEELGQSGSLEIRQYQTVMRHALESLDSKRLEWEEQMYGSTKRQILSENLTYIPSRHINGLYGTKRKYGFMAGWDEARKLIGGLQLVGAEIIPKKTIRENLDGLDDPIIEIEESLRAEKAESVAMDTLLTMAQQGDPRAIAAAVEMLPEGKSKEILMNFFVPEPEEVEEAQNPGPELPEQAPGLDQLMQNPEFLARLNQSGNAGGGVQVRGDVA